MRVLLATLLFFGCNNRIDPFETEFPPVNADVDADADADTDSDTDADADADSDADTDADTDTDGLNCVDPYTTPAPNADPEGLCVTEYVDCGDQIYASLGGGVELYDYDYWSELQELGGLVNDPTAVNGVERIYVLRNLFPGQYVRVELESCDDVWGSYLVTGDITDVCENGPTNAPRGHFYSTIGQTRVSQYREIPHSASSPWDIQFIVDTHPGSTGNFFISFECGPLQ